MNKEDIVAKLRQILLEDNDNMKPENFYRNIENSNGTPEQLAKSFSVPIYIISAIQELSK